LGEPQRAIDLETQAIKLDPKHPHEYVFFVMGQAYFMLGDNDAAIESLLKSLEINPATTGAYVFLAMAYALKGEDAKARAATAEVRRLDPNVSLSTYLKNGVWHPPAKLVEWQKSKLVPAWRKAGLPE
jgi:tetratricopeptide (TPR) repeat protein